MNSTGGTTIKDRLQHYALPLDGHLIWCGVLDRKGYGQLWANGKRVYVHRLAWELAYGLIPKGVHVLHSCDTPPCIEPEHLKLGTDSDNQHDSVRAGNHHSARKTHCKRGHRLTPENIYRRPGPVPHRECRACRWGERERRVARRKRAREAPCQT